MRSLFLLLVTIAVGNCTLSRTRRGAGWGTSLADARINSQEMRLNQLAQELDDLEVAVANGDDTIPASMQSLSIRLNKIEGDDCSRLQFSCGRNSGQCVHNLIVCDGVVDCANEADETDHTCENVVPAGRSWKGVANWNSCMVRSNNHISILITGNKRVDHFPSQLWIDAVIFETYTVSGEEKRETWSMHGHYSFAHRSIELNPPDDSEMGIGMHCQDAGDHVAYCEFVRAIDGHVCGHVTLTREN